MTRIIQRVKLRSQLKTVNKLLSQNNHEQFRAELLAIALNFSETMPSPLKLKNISQKHAKNHRLSILFGQYFTFFSAFWTRISVFYENAFSLLNNTKYPTDL